MAEVYPNGYVDNLVREGAERDAVLERIRVAFQALRDGREHASSKLYRVLATEFPAVLAPKTGEKP
jgi:hypothetical protein